MHTPFQHLMVTGCYRSGTTLLEKLLHAHPNVVLASQAYPLLFAMAKEAFLASRGLERRYPLDHLFLETGYAPGDFEAFLNQHVFDREALNALFDRLEAYTDPSWTPELLTYRDRIAPGPFLHIIRQCNHCLSEIFPAEAPRYVGNKEIMIEEFLPYLLRHAFAVLLIIRDPRDMIASVSFFQQSHMGNHRPLLYNLRSWRRSAAFALGLREQPQFRLVSYERLVHSPREMLDELTAFLGLPPFAEETFAGGIRDQRGAVWQSNSSFSSSSGISASPAGRFKERLPMEVIRYVETVCYPEMRALGYAFEAAEEYNPSALAEYREPIPVTHEKFQQETGYSFAAARVAQEQERMRLLLSDASLSEEEIRQWFIHPGAYAALREAVR